MKRSIDHILTAPSLEIGVVLGQNVRTFVKWFIDHALTAPSFI